MTRLPLFTRLLLRLTDPHVREFVTGDLSSSRATTLLYKVSPSDPVTYAGVAIALGSVALLASYVPARRATSVDPVSALRLD